MMKVSPSLQPFFPSSEEDLRKELHQFRSIGKDFFDNAEWNPPADLERILSYLNDKNPTSRWVHFLKDPSILEDELLRKQISEIFCAFLKECDRSGYISFFHRSGREPTLFESARFLFAINEHLKLASPTEFLDGVVKAQRKAYYEDAEKDISRALLKLMIQNGSLEEGWVQHSARGSAPFVERSGKVVQFFISILLKCKDSEIEKYSKECSFYFCKPSLPRYSLVNKLDRLYLPNYKNVLEELYKHEKGKRELFLQALRGPLNEYILMSLLQSDTLRREPIDGFYLSIELSSESRGVLLLNLLQQNREIHGQVHNRYIKELLDSNQPILLDDWHIFLPVEEESSAKKETIQLILEIINNGNISHPLPIVWIATLLAYLLKIDVPRMSIIKAPRCRTLGDREVVLDAPEERPLGETWAARMTTLDPLPLQKDDYMALSQVVDIFLRKENKKQIAQENLAIHMVQPILFLVLVGLDKLRLSPEEAFSNEEERQHWEKRIEHLMKEILEYLYTSRKSPSGSSITLYLQDPYTLVSFLFSKELDLKTAEEIMAAIASHVDQNFHPLIKPFLKLWNSFLPLHQNSQSS